jgi:antitoxin VapB
MSGLRTVDAEIAALRYRLTDSEIRKYRWLGRHATEAVIAVCRRLTPGVSEREMETMASDELMRRGIRPTVLLMGVDDRVLRFRHTTPSEARLKKYAFVNVCARRWGLVISTGRFVHLGPVPDELRKRVRASANITARFLAHSKPGARAGELLDLARTWFAANGFPGELEHHHQGGAIGYAEREWIAVPGSAELVHERQAFAWNPIVQGALSFDTFVVYKDRVENLNEVPGWPTIQATVGNTPVRLPDILEVTSAVAGNR